MNADPFDIDAARSKILDLVARYNIAGDSHDLGPMLDTFAPDASYESAIFHLKGLNAIREYFEAAWSAETSRANVSFRRHHITTTQIDLTAPDSAVGVIYYMVITNIGPDHSGYYRDDYRLLESGWKIVRRRIWMEWAQENSPFVPEKSKQILRAHGVAAPLTEQRAKG